jgi:predicted nicotinamide N-methyase
MENLPNQPEQKNGKKLLRPWEKLRKLLMSDERLVLLNEFSAVDLNLFKKKMINDKELKIVYEATNEIFKPNIKKFDEIQIIKPITTLSKSDLLKYYQEKVDNTGNLQLWPCEEILTLYCLFNDQKFLNKRIIELGAGFSGLCSLAIKKNLDIGEIYITDGNSKSVEALERNVALNFGERNDIFCKELLWDAKANNEYGEFDIVLISDCLFFKNYHNDLVITIKRLLKKEGECIIIAPPRGDSMDIFLKIAEEFFEIVKRTEEIEFIKLTKNEADNYNPFYIKLTLKE